MNQLLFSKSKLFSTDLFRVVSIYLQQYNQTIHFKRGRIYCYNAKPFNIKYAIIVGTERFLLNVFKKTIPDYNRQIIHDKFKYNSLKGLYIPLPSEQVQGIIWVPLHTTDGTIIHEFSHFADDIFERHHMKNQKEKHSLFLSNHVSRFLFQIRKYYS